MYVKIKDGLIEKFPYTPSDLIQDNPNTSFPHYPADSLMEEFGMYKVAMKDVPTYDRRTQTIEKANIPELVNGSWVLGWNINQKTDEEVARYDNETENFIRTERNQLLRETDYLALSDNTLTAEMAAYRQELRDITNQSNFPHDVVWPTRPL